MCLRLLVFILVFTGIKNFVSASADFGPAKVLPKGRHQLTLRFGEKSHLSEKFDSFGGLQSVQRMNQRFNKEFMLSQSPQLSQLVQFIDSMYPHMQPSENLDPGALGFKGDAAARYVTPQLARGITRRWSVGVAIPVLDYKTTIEPINLGTNSTPLFFKTLSKENASIHPQIGEAEKLMSAGPKAIFNSLTDQKGYKRVEPRNDMFVGDVIVGSSYQMFENKKLELYFMNFLTLPTGPKDDPDDLVDLGVFHKTSLKNSIYLNVKPSYYVELGFGASYTYQFVDSFEKRIPTSEQDMIPGQETKEVVDKKPGNKFGFESAFIFTPIERVEMGLGYDYEKKQMDKYSGENNARYDLLSINSDTEIHIARMKASYSTVTSFIEGKSSVPYSLTYAYSDFFKAKNVEREKTHELLLKVYF